MFNNDYDFRYNNFSISAFILDEYTADVACYKQTNKNDEFSQYNQALGIVDSIISCILSGDFDFRPDNKRIFKSLYVMLRDCGHNNGKYSDEARCAMRKLCEFCGFSANAIELVDKKPMSRFEKITKKISGWFRAKEQKDPTEDIINQMFANKKHEKVEPQQKNDITPVIPETHHVEKTQKEQKQPVNILPKKISKRPTKPSNLATLRANQRRSQKQQQNTNSKNNPNNVTVVIPDIKKQNQPTNISHSKQNTIHTKDKKTPKITIRKKISLRSMFASVITGGIIIGSTMFFGGTNKKSTDTKVNEKSVKALAVAMPTAKTHYNSVVTYNIKKWTWTKQTNSVERNKYKPATDSLSVKLTDASRSALTILIGNENAQKLCKNIRAKFDAGIFQLPDGMSIERVAHAMEMSRIYEGHSIILDALNSDVKLTDAQQQAFNDHIASIGDLGINLQKRMAAKHKLSRNSRYDHANQSLRMTHVKNLKQLKQAKKLLQQTQR